MIGKTRQLKEHKRKRKKKFLKKQKYFNEITISKTKKINTKFKKKQKNLCKHKK